VEMPVRTPLRSICTEPYFRNINLDCGVAPGTAARNRARD
jgi:hypothetical protein